MKYVIAFFLCFSMYNDTELYWRSDYNLTWQDFKATADYTTDAIALTTSGITFNYGIHKEDDEIVGFKSDVITTFYPQKSWRKIEAVTPHILAHEQFHFNITELYARKLRQELSLLKPHKNLVKTLSKLYSTNELELAKMQKAYDFETNHSINKEQQLLWQQKVETQLEQLNAFSL